MIVTHCDTAKFERQLGKEVRKSGDMVIGVNDQVRC